MTRDGFLVLMVVTVLAIVLGATIAEHYTEPGFGRTLVVFGVAAVIVFPAARICERYGLIKGSLDLSKLGQKDATPAAPESTATATHTASAAAPAPHNEQLPVARHDAGRAAPNAAPQRGGESS